MPAVMLQPATSASGAAPLTRLLAGVLLGVAFGVLTGVIAAFANRRLTLTRRPVPGDLARRAVT